MRKILLILCLSISFQQTLFTATTTPLLTIVLMVKDEACVMEETLEPFVKAPIENLQDKLAFFIFDTGSTDETIEVTRNYLKSNGFNHVVIEQEPFIDFAASRNRALDLTEVAFPDIPFMLMPDAEWILHNLDVLLRFCKTHKDRKDPCYNVRIIQNGSLDFCTSRLIRNHAGARFSGVVHETISRVSSEKVPQDCFFTFDPGEYGQEKSRRRWSRDVKKLLEVYEKNPRDSRTVFYIGQTYHCLNELENARLWYQKRIDTPGWDEENFMARYRLAQVHEELGDWDSALCEYLKAFSMRPTRAEPLIQVAKHYLQTKEMDLCFLFSRRATEIPYPENDVLFIDKEMYSYTRFNVLGISAWYAKEDKIGKWAVEKALEAHPNYPHLQTNLQFYDAKD